MIRLSVTARIALLSIGLALVSNLALVGFVWRQTRSDVVAAIRHDTAEQADALTGIYRVGGRRALIQAVRSAQLPSDVSLVLGLVSPTREGLIGAVPRHLVVPLQPTGFRVAMLGRTGAWADHAAGYSLVRLGDVWLLTGRKLNRIAAEQHAIERALALAVFLSLALGVFAGLVLTRYVTRRLEDIVGVVEAAREGDLSRRVSVTGGGGDAFDRLAARLNVMLEKLERVMAELRIVTDSLAHDLRSPLARLRTKAEQAVMIEDTVERDAALNGLLTETDLVMRMLTMVTEISRSEQVSRDRFVSVAPAELVEEVGELYGPVAEDLGLTFEVAIESRPAPMRLHRDLLSQAITNLIDNALRHGAAGGQMVLRLADHDAGVAIQVEDCGPGIAEADHATAMKRFGRLDHARSQPGAGLGMALVEAVARLHGGRFELADNAPGLIARIIIPR